MAEILGEKVLKEYIKKGEIIQNGNINDAEGIKYDFHIGNRFLKAGYNSPKTYEELDALDRAVVEPGEVVFVMTAERLEIPLDINVQLNVKRKISQDGISILGGTNVDPGYHGYLIFGIHNVAGTNFRLTPGRKIMGAIFCRLVGDEIVDESSHIPSPIEDFPDELITLIEKYRPVNPQVINSRLNELQSRLDKDRDTLLQTMESVDNKVALLDEKFDLKFKNVEEKIDDKISNVDDRIGDKIQSLDGKISCVESNVNSINTSVITIKVWGKIMTWIFGIVGGIIAGITTGIFQKIGSFIMQLLM